MTDKILREYNRLCENAYNENPDVDYEGQEFEIILEKCQEKWADTVLDEAHGSIGLWLMNLSFEELSIVFEQLCESDFPMPKAVLRALDRFEQQACEYLANHAFDMLKRKDLPTVYVSIQAVKALGRLKKTSYIPDMISYVKELPQDEELFIESVTEGLMEMGCPVVGAMVECINGADVIDNNMEYMLQALSQLGRDNKSSDVFNCLKSAFLRMEHKDLGALCIAEYNDVRGIAFLNTWLDNYKTTLSREIYYEILHCIKALGGRVELF